MTENVVRVKAVCLCRRGDEILVTAGYDPTKDERFFIPAGGGVEFGELAADAARREMREELGVELGEVTLVGVFENLFAFDAKPGHEIVFAFVGAPLDPAVYERTEIHGHETNHDPIVATWQPIDRFREPPWLYPEGLLDALTRS